MHITAYRYTHKAAPHRLQLRRVVDAAEWRAADAIVGAWLAIDGVVTSIGLNLLAHETHITARKRELRRLRKARMERRCQHKIAREKRAPSSWRTSSGRQSACRMSHSETGKETA